MAKKDTQQNSSSVESRSFTKGMIKDVNESLMGKGTYLHARNAVNNSKSGDLGLIANEASNKYCISAPYTIIGAIHVYGDLWAIFSTDNVDSEIGTFDESACVYTTVANDQCLNFSKEHLIIGESKENFDCTWDLYWADGNNPDRTINIENPPWVQDCNFVDDCEICHDTDVLNCDLLRMARLTTPPCIRLEAGVNGGELLNGTYQAVIAYTENEQRISDYSIPSNLVSLFEHRDVSGALEVVIESIDQTYDEFELVIIGFVNKQGVARRMGVYSTHQNRISIDRVDPAANETVPIELIPLDRPAYEKSEAIYRNGEYLLRVSPSTRFSFNYQPLANNINTDWLEVRYPAKYYRDAGTNVGYMRDEVYSFFIRWIYDTYDKSESYHIPGRAPGPYGALGGIPETDPSLTGLDPSEQIFETYNTGYQVGFIPFTLPDGGQVTKKGRMGYWQSSEIYPDNKPDVWADLCGKNIRHHKMPDNALSCHFVDGGQFINVLGVQFNNIAFPIDNQGNPIPGIIGYEILRGTREGNKSIVAKGMINNMGRYRNDDDKLIFYQNYPYNDLRRDPYLSQEWTTNDDATILPWGFFDKSNFTFHSPDTSFKHPFLSSKELKTYITLMGNGEGRFAEVYKHPEHKILTDVGFLLAAIIGLGTAVLSMRGTMKSKGGIDGTPAVDFNSSSGGVYSTATGVGGVGINATTAALSGGATAAAAVAAAVADASSGATALTSMFGVVGDGGANAAAYSSTAASAFLSQGITGAVQYEWDSDGASGIPGFLRLFSGAPAFLNYWNEGTSAFIRIIKAFSKWEQHAVAFQSHCFYDTADKTPGVPATAANYRKTITEGSYIKDRLQEFGGITVNNLFRNATVGLRLSGDMPDPVIEDTSRRTMIDSGTASANPSWLGNVPATADLRNKEFELNGPTNGPVTTAHYSGLKQRLRNQYGQVDGIIQIPTSSCMQPYEIDPNNPQNATSEVIFGGDTYIGRYTEKNTFFYYFDWMFDVPNGFEFDYRLRKMLPYPTFWMDTHEFSINDFVTGIFDSLSGGNTTGTGTAILPSDWHNFERSGIGTIANFGTLGSSSGGSSSMSVLNVKNAQIHLFHSGVRDFFVESEVNVEYRDWEDEEFQRHYDPYLHTAYEDLFRSDRIKYGNFWKYDYSLSASRYYQPMGSWGTMQYRNYDPQVAETCYTYYPNRVIYSWPQATELRHDNWLIYLIDNYKDFTSRVTTVKPIGKNGAMFLFETEAPLMVPGVDILETDAGTKITIGDGGLFSQPMQNLVNADESYEYGSCQNRLSVANTPSGLYWISQNQGKIFNYTGKLADIAQQGMKWWFDEFLPYKLTEDFPTYDLLDNTVIGIGCQTIYDNADGIVYFTKRDFKLRPEYIGRVQYLGNNEFSVNGVAGTTLGDRRIFDDASWTVSYDPKTEAWVSFHDWHPNFLLPSKNNFMSIKNAGIWKHNDRTDSYCNYYGINYPFEVELVTPTGQTVNTLRSVEYIMEVFQWDVDGVDRFHVLDFNFDRAVVYNTEQISGYLRLNLSPKNNAPEIIRYPIQNAGSTEILYSKEEQKYRFNQFWDIVDDRGEFTTAARVLWNTEPNGYIHTINPVAVNYNKPQHQRKKFRHYQSNLFLSRQISGNNNMQLKLINSKNQYSPR
jgi:hypothetical protein